MKAAQVNGLRVEVRPRVLFVASDERHFWGHLLPVARAALQKGFDVLVALSPGAYEQRIRYEGFKLIPLRLRRNSYAPWNELLSIRQLQRIYKQEQPDIVHHLSLKTVLYGSIAARAVKNLRVANSICGLGYLVASSSWKARMLRPLIWFACKRYLDSPYERILVENKEDRDNVVSSFNVSGERIIVTCGAGVDMDVFQPSPEPPGMPAVLLASRMLWIKGIADFVEAARLLHRGGLSARFILVGDVDPSPASIPRQQLLDWQASGDVEWWGHRDDMAQVYRESTLVCLPSHGGEGVPRVLVEAAGSGRALISTDVPGCRDIVRSGFNGIVVPPRNAPALAAAIEALLKDPAERTQMASRSRQLAVNKFSLETVIRQTLALYAELLDLANPGMRATGT